MSAGSDAVAVAWLDGQLEPDPSRMRVAALDHAITVGDGIFESIKAVDGVPFALGRHLDRLERSAAATGLALPMPRDEIELGCRAVAEAAALPLGKIRLTVTAGPAGLTSRRSGEGGSVLIAVAGLAPPAPSAAVATVPWRRNEHGALTGVKSTSYLENVVAIEAAVAAGASEALLANTAGALCEGTGSNIFVVIDGTAVTPPLSDGPLAGVTRGLVLELSGDTDEQTLPMSVLDSCEEAFLTSATRNVQPIHAIDGRPVSVEPTALTARLATALAELERTTPEP